MNGGKNEGYSRRIWRENGEYQLPLYPNHDIYKKIVTIHGCWKTEKKCEYLGQTFRKGDYISWDTLYHEWEWFADKDTHLGAINPLTGAKYKNGDPKRKLKLP